MNSISAKGMIPSLQQQREHPTPSAGATHTKGRTNNGSIESWGKQQQQIHRHAYQNISYDSDQYCDPYHILHIRHDATKYEMKRAYQHLALLYHPSLTTTMTMHHNAFSHEEHKQELLFLFTLIAASYETLSIKETRQRLDMILLQQRQQNEKKNQIQHSSTIARLKSEKHKISSPKQNDKDDKSNGSNIIIISKAEYKIRKRLREERRVQQQQRRSNDSNKAKHNKTKRGEAQRASQALKQQSTPLKVALSPSSSTASTYNYHHRPMAQQIDDDSARDGTDNSSASPSRHNIATTKAKRGEFHPDSSGSPCSREHRKSQKRGYNWAYVPSPCDDEATHNDIQNDKNNGILSDGPLDQVDEYYCHSGTSTATIPTVVHHSSSDHSNHINVIPPPLVESSDSEVKDDDNDSDYLLSLQNITKDFYDVNRPKSTANTNDAKERWFGGPLKLMYRARKFQPFTDSFELFERTFRSGLIVPKLRRQLASFSTDCVDSNQNNSNHRIVGLLPMNGIVSPSTLATFSSNRNVVPISAADDVIETLADGTIVTRTYRTVPITTTTTEHQQETLYKTLTRTITRYPPPLDPSNQNCSNHYCRMTVSVESDVAVRVDQNSVLTSSTSFGNSYNNHCVDCIGWMNCQSTGSHAKAAMVSNNHHNNGYFSFTSMLQSWLPSC